MGRDGYVRVAYPGILFPFGHRCVLVNVTQREIKHRDTPVAYLWQRWFIIVRQPTRTYPPGDRDNPFGQVTVSPLVTPDIDKPPDGLQPFVPVRTGVPFPFTLTTVDRGGTVKSWPAPLVFVRVDNDGPRTFVRFPRERVGDVFACAADPGARASARGRATGQGRGYLRRGHAPDLRRGDELEERDLAPVPHRGAGGRAVDAAPRAAGTGGQPRLRAALSEGRASGAGARRQARARRAERRRADPRAEERARRRRLQQQVGGRAGGFVAPNLSVQGISRVLGAVGEKGNGPSPFDAGTFDPASFLSGAMPKLFGLFNLLELLDPGSLDEAPAFVSDALDTVTKLLTEAQRLKKALDDAQARLTQEVAQAAHGGAQAVAQHAKDELDARAP